MATCYHCGKKIESGKRLNPYGKYYHAKCEMPKDVADKKLFKAIFGKRKSGSWSVTSKKRVIRRAKTTKALKRKSYKRK